MGKGQRSRLARADEVKAKKAAAKKKAKRDKIVRIFSIILTVVLVVGVASVITVSTVNETNRKNGTYLKNDIALSSANFKITNAQLLYAYLVNVSNDLNTNQSTYQMYGLDTEKSLKSQNYPSASEDGTTITWYDFFMNSTTSQINQIMVLAEGAKANNIKLDEDEIKEIDEALEAQTDLDQIVPGLKQEDLRPYFEMSQLAAKYEEQIKKDIEPDNKTLESYYKENENTYQEVDYRMYSFSYKAAEEGENAAMTKDEAKAYADKLAATGTEEAYVAWLKDYFTNVLKPSDIDSELAATLSEGFAYNESYTGNDFLFGKDTKVGDIKVINDETDECYKVFLLKTAKHRDEEATRTVRHILISPAEVEDSEDEEATAKANADAKEKAEKLLADWKANKPTEDSFAALVHDNTADTGSQENGGLYENFGRGEMVTEFEDWAYNADRKKGDTGIVETTYGYHIMYFVGTGDPAWEVDATANYTSEKYSEQYEQLEKKHTVTVDDGKIEKIATYIP